MAFLTPPTRRSLASHYDRLGLLQENEAWYEDAAFDDLIARWDFCSVRSIVEVGPGTGRFAERLFERVLPRGACYLGLEVSGEMARLSSERLARRTNDAHLCMCDATGPWPVADGTVDVVIATFVFDLMSDDQVARVLALARRALGPDGVVCAASLARGETLKTRLRALGWALVNAVSPLRVGGCRPRDLQTLFGRSWRVMSYMQCSIDGCAIASAIAKPAGA